MKERSGPHYVGQQLAFLSPPHDFTLNNKHLGDPFAKPPINSNGTGSGGQFSNGALSANNNSLNNAQYQSQQQRKKIQMQGGSGGSGMSGNNNTQEQRQLNMADMVRGSNIIKQTSFQKRDGYPTNPQLSAAGQALALNAQQEQFIKGTQVQKDFQLVAEPLLPKASGNQYQTLSHANSQNVNGPQQNISSTQISYNNTAISTIQGPSSSDQGSGLGLSTNHYSQNSSRKNLESYYSTANSKVNGNNFAQDNQQSLVVSQNQALQQLIQQQNPNTGGPHYTTNRSVAAKAGQMQIFSNDKYSHLPSSNNSTQNNKFQSPAKNLQNNTKMVGGHHHQQSASQQIENMIDLQQMRLRNSSGQQNQNQKYSEYLNRFSTTNQSVDQTQNLQGKYRDLKNQMLDQDTGFFHQDTSSGQESTPLELVSQAANFNGTSTTAITNVATINYSNQQKRSPAVQKENVKAQEAQSQGLGLGISGESMHLEEKTFLKKMAGMVGQSIEPLNVQGNASQRHAGSGRKRQEISVGARGINRGFRAGIDSQHLQIQQRTRYDYVFVRLPEDQFDKEFSDKIIFTRDPGEQSPSMMSFKNKRISGMTTTSSKKEEPSQAVNIQQQTPQLMMYNHQKSLRGSQEYLKENSSSVFSPLNKNVGGPHNQGMEEIISIQNLHPDHKCLAGTPKMIGNAGTANTCSIISTNHTHIKVITHQGVIGQSGTFGELSIEQLNLQQHALNECVQDVMSKVQEKGRVVKTTQKKKYIFNVLNAPHMRVASIFVVVLDNNVTYYGDNPDLRTTLMSDSSTTSSNNFNSTLTKLQNSKNIQKQVLKKDSQIILRNNQDQMNAKNLRMRNNSTINSKGYDSESEVKSTNSTTTSSTLQHFIPTRNFEQNNGSSTTKNSSRSLSQKGGAQPRKNFQKPQAAAPIEDQITSFVVQRDGQIKSYPPTKIKIVSPYDQTHLETHKINVCLKNYNNFIQLCFKQKGKMNISAVAKLGKQLGLNLTTNMFTEGALKSREQGNMIKEKLIAYLCKVINEENLPENMPENPLVQEAVTPLYQPVHQYKCFVGKGNNSILIRTLFKTRFWWLLHDKEEIEKVNFMWTQLRKNPIMDTFPCKFEDKKSGLRTHGGSSNSSVMQTPGKLKQKKKMSMQSSSLSLDGSVTVGSSSNDKKDQKGDQNVGAQQSNSLTPASQQLAVKFYNKLEDNFHLSNKKAMFLNIRLYYEAMGKDVFNAVPMTFHVKEGLEDAEFQRFKQHYFKEEEEIKRQKQMKNQIASGDQNDGEVAPISIKKNIWIVKPGENTNRGQGITVLKEFDEIKAFITESTANKKRTCIVQKYIHNPLLIHKRKFDIRLYAFLSSVNGNLKGYFYADGYLRTSCREFTLANLSNRMIHLTNDAVQKHAEDYGKYEAGNKLSYTEFQTYLDKNYADLNICFERDLLPQMKRLVTDMFRAVYGKIDPKRRINTIEIYGYDFMFDDDFKVYLIEVNTNPCLELGCPLLARLIPTMVENALRLSVDPLFPAPENWSQKKCVVNDICPENKFELIFDEKVDGPYLTDLMKEKNNIIIEIDEEELSDNDVIEKDDGEVA